MDSTTDSDDDFQHIRERLEITDDGEELLVTFWTPAYDYDPIEASGGSHVLVRVSESEPEMAYLSAFSCDSVVNTSTATVSIDGETYFEDADSPIYRLETMGVEVFIPRNNICRVLRVPRSGVLELELDQDMGFNSDADPFRSE